MRRFNYIKDYNIIPTTINGYLTQLSKEIRYLKENEKNPFYEFVEKVIDDFRKKYPYLSLVSSKINNDLAKPYNIEFAFKNKRFPDNASTLGIQFEESLNYIFALEEKLRKLAIELWEKDLTKFEDIINGEDFMIVAHASEHLPGTVNNANYKAGAYNHQYLSCSLLSNKEFNTFHGKKAIFMFSVSDDNYISSSSVDAVTADFPYSSFETIKEIEDKNGNKHFIKVGFTDMIDRAVTTISTPKLIEQFSIDREIRESGQLFDYSNSLTNEVVLDRTNAKVSGALLVSNGHDLLFDEYIYFKRNNISFKCLNIGLYKEKEKLPPFNKDDISELAILLSNLNEYMKRHNLDAAFLSNYYNDVILPMKYNPIINSILFKAFSEYIDISKLNLDGGATR